MGIPTLEEKSVQRATGEGLHALSEGDCLGCASGCRPGRGPHDVLDAVTGGLAQRTVINWGLDVDMRGVFAAIAPAWLVQCLAPRMGDRRLIRHRRTWLTAGGLEEGQGHAQAAGPPHGGSVRPLAATISRPYVLARWADRWRRRSARGEVIIVR